MKSSAIRRRQAFTIFAVILTLIILPVAVFISQQTQEIRERAASTQDTSPYGATTIHADQQLITDFHDLNIHWLRYQIAGVPNMSQLDADVARLNAAGIHIDFSIHCLSGSCFNNPPLAPISAYVNLAAQLASRYNGQSGHGTIDAYEIGNEEFDFYPPNTYPPYLKAGCQAIKAANPQALCGMYGTFTPNITHYSSVVSAIFAAGDGQYMDFMNFHYYVHGNDPSVGSPPYPTVLQTYHQIASQNGFAKMPVWVTEVGWPTAAVSCCKAITPQQQSQYLQYVMDQSRTSGVVQRVFWFTMDYGDQGDSLDRSSTGRLPAFFTYQQYIQQYPMWLGTLTITPPFPSSTSTPTPAPSVSPQLSLTPTVNPSATPTPNPNDTIFSFAICPHGLGKCGDNVNPNGGGNANPLHTTRTINFTVTDANNNQVAGSPFSGQVVYVPSSQDFQGTVSIPNLANGQYLITVKMDGYLAKQIPGFITSSQGQQVTLPEVVFVTGDIGPVPGTNNIAYGDNQLDITDYNMLVSCFGAKMTSSSCLNPPTQQFPGADISDDGTINGVDYNIFLRELSVQKGQ